jgi:hypothetical protein
MELLVFCWVIFATFAVCKIIRMKIDARVEKEVNEILSIKHRSNGHGKKH